MLQLYSTRKISQGPFAVRKLLINTSNKKFQLVVLEQIEFVKYELSYIFEPFDIFGALRINSKEEKPGQSS